MSLKISWPKFHQHCRLLVEKVIPELVVRSHITGVTGVPSGGILPAAVIAYQLRVPVKSRPTMNSDLIVDEIVDHGPTYLAVKKRFPDNPFCCLYLNSVNFPKTLVKPPHLKKVTSWVTFPWEDIHEEHSTATINQRRSIFNNFFS